MNPIGGITLAWRALRRRRLRTLLMMLGVSIGICSLTVVGALGEASRQQMMKRFKNMIGTFDTIMIRPGADRTRGMVSLTNVPGTLKFEDAAAIAAEVPGIKRIAELQNAFDLDVKYRDHPDSTAVFGVSANWFTLRGDDAARGSLFTEADDRNSARVAVLGADVASRCFGTEDPVGKSIRIADIPFEVRGVLQSRGAGPGGGSLDDLILIPIQTASKRLFHRDYLTMLIVQVDDADRSDASVQAITALLRNRHRLAPSALDDFTISNPRVLAGQVTKMNSTLTATLKGVALLSMLLGGVVITALMLIATGERRKQIGICRSVGATSEDVMWQFAMEAVLVAVAGGIAGVVIALAAMRSSQSWAGMPLESSWRAFAYAIALSACSGLVFGLYPAWRAARVDPVAALRG
jgi:putative ABC transport system permease protein